MNKYLWAAIGLAAALLLAVSAVAGPLARLPSSQLDSRGIFVQYDTGGQNIDRAHGYPVTGGHHRYAWSLLEPSEGQYQFDAEVRDWVVGEAQHGKKAAIGFETYVRRNTGSAPYAGVAALPTWLHYQPVIKWNTVDSLYYVTNFLDPTYQAKYSNFIHAFAAWLAAPANAEVLANVAWIEMGVGMEAETQPADSVVNGTTYNDWLYYRNVAPGGQNPPGWTSYDWYLYVKWCVDLYYDAFRVSNPSLASVSIYLNCAPEFTGKDNVSNRDAFTNYAATKGIGLKNNGLQPDRSPANLYAPLERWGSIAATVDVPIAWETYAGAWIQDVSDLYWAMLCALEKHPDVIEPTRWLLMDYSYNPLPEYIAVWNWVDPYLGVTPDTTPSIWCALRETAQPNGEPGNYFFWLYQNDNLSGGRTVPVWLSGKGKEGDFTRRTDAPGNPYIHFQVLNSLPFFGNPSHETLTVTVTYADQGTDQWKLRYDSTTGMRDAPQGPVQKHGTDAWQKAVFVLTDARFGNGFWDTGASAYPDLTVDSMDGVNEYIHMVEITRRTAGGTTPTPIPTPTATPVDTILRGRVTLQGRPTPPDARWVVALTVNIGGANYPAITDTSGWFTVTGLTGGTYDICVKSGHTVSNRRTGVTLVAGYNDVDFGTLREGDTNNDDKVSMLDFSRLAAGFSPVNDLRADFNQDGQVTMLDFSRLAANFNVKGDCLSP